MAVETNHTSQASIASFVDAANVQLDISKNFGLEIAATHSLLDANTTSTLADVDKAYTTLKQKWEKFALARLNFHYHVGRLKKNPSDSNDWIQDSLDRCALNNTFLDRIEKEYQGVSARCNRLFYLALNRDGKVSCTTYIASYFFTYDFHQEYVNSNANKPGKGTTHA